MTHQPKCSNINDAPVLLDTGKKRIKEKHGRTTVFYDSIQSPLFYVPVFFDRDVQFFSSGDTSHHPELDSIVQSSSLLKQPRKTDLCLTLWLGPAHKTSFA